ncbi:MAG TPA: hypothetical protein VJP79_01735 [Nitrososphaera sp.]|nr:hypothetical protein [Nitrososphaera sp.]
MIVKHVAYYAAAAATAVAGVLHLMLGPGILGFNMNQGILFIVGGMAQVFWIIPMVRRWGRGWYTVGIAGTAVFMALFFITRLPGNPITGRGAPTNSMSLLLEIFQGIFIALAAAVLAFEIARGDNNKKPSDKKKKNRKHIPILAGIVIALILAGLFVFPILMPRPMGGGGGPPRAAGQSGQQAPAPADTTPANLNCTLTPSLIEVEETPQQTEGPYFLDNMPNRADIRPDSSSGALEEGIPLNLTIHVYDSDDGSCVPMKGAKVDLWQANSQGRYSGVEGNFGTDYLRGYQLTDDNGTANFSTIYPGWYEGRAIHIHVKVRTLEGGANEKLDWTSQFYLPDDMNEKIHTQPPYSSHGPVDTANAHDSIYAGPSTDGLVESNTGRHLMLVPTAAGSGYTGSFNIVLDAS